MNGLEVILALLVTRLVLPLFAMLALGEWVHRREAGQPSRS
jgi:hypothetical protein